MAEVTVVLGSDEQLFVGDFFTARFEEGDDRGHRDVQRIGLTCHGNSHRVVAVLEPKFAESVLFASHHDREWTAEIRLGVDCFRSGRGCHGPNSFVLQPPQHVRTFFHDERHGKQHAGRSADHVGVEDIGDWIADYDSVATGGIRTAQNRAEVSWFFDRFDNEEKRRFC